MRDIIITENGINKLLQNINIHKASGPDNIHGRILKECTTQIAPILTTLFSLSFKTGKIPDDWRYASVCPAFQKGDKNNPINYRPISLTCIICKLLEHVVRYRPFNLQRGGGLCLFVSFRIFFSSDNTRVRIFFFVAQCANFFSKRQH